MCNDCAIQFLLPEEHENEDFLLPDELARVVYDTIVDASNRFKGSYVGLGKSSILSTVQNKLRGHSGYI
jgi:hypothetical protein